MFDGLALDAQGSYVAVISDSGQMARARVDFATLR
jgi:hypothetical protein